MAPFADVDMLVRMRKDVISRAILPGIEAVGVIQKLKVGSVKSRYQLSHVIFSGVILTRKLYPVETSCRVTGYWVNLDLAYICDR